MDPLVKAGRTELSGAPRKRLRREIIDCLADFPRQYSALEHAMAAFGGDFDLQTFKQAFHSDDLDAYNRVQAVERALGRVQNFVGDLARAGVKLAQLQPARDAYASPSAKAFAALRDAKVIDGRLCARLIRAQEARSMIEHSYVQTSAGKVHESAELVRQSARDFIARYRGWIEPYLTDGSEQPEAASDAAHEVE
jgi:uncharacterized protein YutE (UPF0331/DUF86 family)